MRNDLKQIAIFCGGVVTGGLASFIACRQYYKKRYEMDRDQLEGYYKGVDKYARVEHEEDNEVNPNEKESKPGGRMSPEERAVIKEKLKMNHKITTNYAKMYHMEGEDQNYVDPAEEEYPEDDEVLEEECCRNCFRCTGSEKGVVCSDNREEFDYNATETDCPAYLSKKEMIEDDEEERIFEEHQQYKGKPPKIISADAYSNLDQSIDQNVMYFYSHDEVLVDEDENVIEDPERFLGNCLTKYGFIDSDERIIFVMNYELRTCYEVQKIEGSYSDSK